MTDCVVGLVTCGSREQARQIARALITANRAACVNILDGIESHYRWQGKLEQASEQLLVIKTTAGQTRAVEKIVQDNHTDELPEIIFLPISGGESRYLDWLRGEVQ